MMNNILARVLISSLFFAATEFACAQTGQALVTTSAFFNGQNVFSSPPQFFSSTSFTPELASHHGHKNLADGKNCVRKPGADIAIVSREFVNLNPGEIKDFAVDLTAANAAGHLHVEIQADKGLQVLSPQLAFDFNLTESATVTLPVQLGSNQQGSWVLNVLATITDDQGQSSARAMALIVQVGNLMTNNGQQKSQSSLTSEGENVIVMPASEVIR